MRIMGWVLAGMLALIGPWQPTPAADISVPPGDGTLAAAIAGASDGDTLLLAEGSYTGVATVNKSLAIRAESRAVHPVIAGGLSISGVGIRVTIQGLTFSAELVPDQASEIRLLQNQWVNVSLDAISYKTTEGDGSLMVIGNRFVNAALANVYSDDAYIAGNVFSGGYVTIGSSAWIVGNDIYTSNTTTNTAISASGGFVRVIGNRLICIGNSSCLYSGSVSSLIANNLVESRFASSDSVKAGIDSRDDTTIVNNVVVGGPGGLGTIFDFGIRTTVPGARISGNIVVEFSSNGAKPIVAAAPAEVTHNLCFNTTGSCPDGDGNLNLDPQFVDLLDYRLAPTSPAIDAGPFDHPMADLDRTRNDMGIHGGPWSIGQFDAQRDPYTLAPYVYPRFEGVSGYQGTNIAVKAIGVARLR